MSFVVRTSVLIKFRLIAFLTPNNKQGSILRTSVFFPSQKLHSLLSPIKINKVRSFGLQSSYKSEDLHSSLQTIKNNLLLGQTHGNSFFVVSRLVNKTWIYRRFTFIPDRLAIKGQKHRIAGIQGFIISGL